MIMFGTLPRRTAQMMPFDESGQFVLSSDEMRQTVIDGF